MIDIGVNVVAAVSPSSSGTFVGDRALFRPSGVGVAEGVATGSNMSTEFRTIGKLSVLPTSSDGGGGGANFLIILRRPGETSGSSDILRAGYNKCE